MNILDGLNESQRSAVIAPPGHILVLAGPGTGKTLTITRRIAYLISQGMKPENIYAITFTNKAALELKTRIMDFVKDGNDVFTGTFHLLALKIIKESIYGDFSIINRSEQYEILKGIVRAGQIERALERICRIKNFIEEIKDDFREVFHAYQRLLHERRLLDLDDLIIKAIDIISGEDGGRWKGIIKELIVDEYQDINPLQYRFLRQFPDSHIYAVGDPDQSIYSFRGANVENFLRFKDDYSDTRIIFLDKNYRSNSNIIDTSESLIRHNKNRMPRTIISLKKEGYPVNIVSVPDEFAEIDFIVKTIEERLGGMSMINRYCRERTDYSLSDFAILLRTNSQALAIESALKQKGIPCYIMGRLINDEIDHAITYVKENLAVSLSELIDTLKKNSSFFKSLSNEYEPVSPEDLLNWIKLIGSRDEEIPAEYVRILTLHMAKGLEFRVVFIQAVEEGFIPYKTAKTEDEIEEERRLLYVGMTRAKQELFLIHARKRRHYGRVVKQFPSRFLSEIPDEYFERIFIPDKMTPQEKQIRLF